MYKSSKTKFLSLFLSLAVVFASLPFTAMAVCAAETEDFYKGTDSNWHIKNEKGFEDFAASIASGTTFSKGTVVLDADIDFNNVERDPIKSGFAGTFDGQNHKISNININKPNDEYVALFSYATGTFKNINIEDADISGKNHVAVLVGSGVGSKFQNINISGNVTISGNKYIGAVGGHVYGSAENCTVKVSDTSLISCANKHAGGIIGYTGEGSSSVSKCYSNIDLECTGLACVGGIVGTTQEGVSVTDCTVDDIKITQTSTTTNAKYIYGYGAISGVYLCDSKDVSTITGNTGKATIKTNWSEVLEASNGVVGSYYESTRTDIDANLTLENNEVTVDFNGTIYPKNHTHGLWEYSASGTDITAECKKAGTCDLKDNKKSITLSAAQLSYTGSPITKTDLFGGMIASFTDFNNVVTGSNLSVDSIKLYDKSTTELSEITNAGTYTAKLTVGTGTNIATATSLFTIDKANLSLSEVTATSITYGQTLASSTIIVTATDLKGNKVTGTSMWTTPTTMPEVSDSNPTEYEVTFTPDDTGNYATATTMAKLVVNKATPTLSSVTATSITYGEKLSDSTVNGSATYSGGNVAGTFKFTNGDTKPSVTNSGTTKYEVIFTPTTPTNFNTTTTNITLAINKATKTDLTLSENVPAEATNNLTITIPVPEAGGSYATPTSSGTVSATNMSIATETNTLTYSVPASADKATGTITILVVSCTNYYDYNIIVNLTAVSSGGGSDPTPEKKEAKTEEEVKEEIAKGGEIEVKEDITLKEELDVTKDSTITAGGKTLTVEEGISVQDGANLAVNDAKIESKDGNTSITVNDGASVTLENTTVSGSQSDEGAVNVAEGATLVVKAGTNITGNTTSDGTTPCNTYIGANSVIDTSNLKPSDAENTKIGVTTEVLPTEGNPVIISGANSEDVSGCFVSDNDKYEIIDYIPDMKINADEVVHYVALALKADEPKFIGWKQTDGKWQYYKDGKFLTDWHNDIPGWEGQWFYFDNTTGYAKSAWADDIHGWEGQWFYFNPNTCVMMKNWVYDGGTRFFYLDDNTGVMKKGWQFLNWSGGANWFYFDNNGICLTNTKTPDGYYVDSNGVWK